MRSVIYSSNRVTFNAISNYGGRGVSLFANLFLVPAYIHFLGTASFGLVGFLAALQMVLQLADVGMSAGLNREMARIASGASEWCDGSELLRSMEKIYAGAALVLVAASIAAAPLVRMWLRPGSLTAGEVDTAVLCTGITTAASLCSGLYGAALLGTQNHLLYNIATTAIVLVRGGGTLVMFVVLGASTNLFFTCQAAATICGLPFLYLLTRCRLPENPRAQKVVPGRLRRFLTGAGGISLSTALGVLLTTQDRFVLGHFCSLSEIGAYSAAGTLASVPLQITAPLAQTLFPRFAELTISEELRTEVYVRSMSMICSTVVPLGIMLVVCGPSFFLAWTRNAHLVSLASPVISFLALGYLCQAVAALAYHLELAQGVPKMALALNTVQAIITPILLLSLVPRLGILAGGVTWSIINVTYALLYAPLVHRRFARTAAVPFVRVTLLSAAISLCIALPLRSLLASRPQDTAISAVFLVGGAVASVLSAWAMDKHTRAIISRLLRSIGFRSVAAEPSSSIPARNANRSDW